MFDIFRPTLNKSPCSKKSTADNNCGWRLRHVDRVTCVETLQPCRAQRIAWWRPLRTELNSLRAANDSQIPVSPHLCSPSWLHTHTNTHTHMDDVSSFLQCSEWWLVRVVMATSHRPSHVRRNITRHWVRLVLRRGTICSIPSWYVTCHSGQLSLLPRQDGKWVPAKEQRQRCTAGKVIGGLISHWPCVIDCYIHVQAEWPKEGRLTPCLHSPNKYGTTEVQRLKVSLKGPLFNLTQGWIMVPPGHKAWKRLLAPRTYIYI